MKLALRVVALAALFAAVAEAFQAPALNSRVAGMRSAPPIPERTLTRSHSSRPPIIRCPGARGAVSMSMESAVAQMADTTTVQLTNALLASKETDFGGYTGPAVGILVVIIAIAALTNPYDDLKQ